MNDLEKLDFAYQLALKICDPIDFAQRQKNLVYAISDYLLKPLNDAREKEEKKGLESFNKIWNVDDIREKEKEVDQ